MEIYIRVAQWIAHQTSNLGVAGSSPVMDTLAQIPKLVKGDRFKFYCVMLRGFKSHSVQFAYIAQLVRAYAL